MVLLALIQRWTRNRDPRTARIGPRFSNLYWFISLDRPVMFHISLIRWWKRTIHGYYQYIFIALRISSFGLFYINGSITSSETDHGACSKCNTCRWRCNGCNCINACSTLWRPSHRLDCWYRFRSWFQIYSGNLKRFWVYHIPYMTRDKFYRTLDQFYRGHPIYD